METVLKQRLDDLVNTPVKWNCPLATFTSFRIGGPAQVLVTLENEVELRAVLQLLREYNIAWQVIGKGTNLLVSDDGFEGAVLLLKGGFKSFEARAQKGTNNLHYVTVGGGAGLTRFAHFCVDKGLSGLEFASGIPGTVGGAVIMNAGAWGCEISEVIQSVTVVDARGRRVFKRQELNFGYRCWRDHQETDLPFVVTEVVVRLMTGDRLAMKEKCEEWRQKRIRIQPQIGRNAGSIFKNPPEDSAGRLIEASGLKGMKIGGAMVSPVHANFIVNCGGATAADVLELMGVIRSRVAEDSGVILESEVHCL
jgi:UDP-N-acetylmuramate dehydrogenase